MNRASAVDATSCLTVGISARFVGTGRLLVWLAIDADAAPPFASKEGDWKVRFDLRNRSGA